jgi:hypothetical protein
VVVDFAMPWSATTTDGPTPTSNPSLLSRYLSVSSLRKDGLNAAPWSHDGLGRTFQSVCR